MIRALSSSTCLARVDSLGTGEGEGIRSSNMWRDQGWSQEVGLGRRVGCVNFRYDLLGLEEGSENDMAFNKGLKSVLLAPNLGTGEGGVVGSSNVWRGLGGSEEDSNLGISAGSRVGCLDV